MQKVCNTCGELKDIAAFPKKGRVKLDGTEVRKGRCSKCTDKRAYQARSDYHKAKAKRWQSENRDKQLHSRHKWNTKRRVKGNDVGSHSLEEWEQLKAKYEHTCLCCGKREPEITLTRDHIVPLQSGGLDTIGNIQPLCKPCNSKKGTAIIDYRS